MPSKPIGNEQLTPKAPWQVWCSWDRRSKQTPMRRPTTVLKLKFGGRQKKGHFKPRRLKSVSSGSRKGPTLSKDSTQFLIVKNRQIPLSIKKNTIRLIPICYRTGGSLA